MPMAIEPAPGHLRRRTWLAAAGALGLAEPAAATARLARAPRFAAAWDVQETHHVGLLEAAGGRLRPAASIDVPTRAHGLVAELDGTLIAVARRPGDWLLRWHPQRRRAQWRWAEPARSFNGHALLAADGRRLFTTETDTDSGASLVGVRDAATLRKLDEWPTHGIDAHELLPDGGSLLVANGGVATRPETGRVKHGLDRMDPSLVRLDATTGRLLGQWRLADPRLSLRHLASAGGRVGIALQAEHDDAAQRAAAPVLAVFDGERLGVITDGPPMSGYAGDIAAHDSGFVLSSPRSGRIVFWHPLRGWDAARVLQLREACALAGSAGGLWVGGQPQALSCPQGGQVEALALPTLPAIRLDNHWCPV
jgi:uncharacterized protein